VFETILRLCAAAQGKILSVHAVRAHGDVLRLVERHLSGTNNRVVLHWFSGSAAEARRAAALGCYFSINHLMLAKLSATSLIEAVPKERLLTETDGPFTKVGSRPSVPADVEGTVKAAASLLGISEQEMGDLLLRNLNDLERGEATERTGKTLLRRL
jgi:TatD DNase family protein